MSLACSFASRVTYRWRRKTSAASATVGAPATCHGAPASASFRERSLATKAAWRRAASAASAAPPRPLRDGHGRDEVEVEVRVELGGVGRRLGRGRAVQGVRGGGKGARARARRPTKDRAWDRPRETVVIVAPDAPMRLSAPSRGGPGPREGGTIVASHRSTHRAGPRRGARRGAERHRSPRSGALCDGADSWGALVWRQIGRLKIMSKKNHCSKAHRSRAWYETEVSDRRTSLTRSGMGTWLEMRRDSTTHLSSRHGRDAESAREGRPRVVIVTSRAMPLLPPYPRRLRVGVAPGIRGGGRSRSTWTTRCGPPPRSSELRTRRSWTFARSGYRGFRTARGSTST